MAFERLRPHSERLDRMGVVAGTGGSDVHFNAILDRELESIVAKARAVREKKEKFTNEEMQLLMAAMILGED